MSLQDAEPVAETVAREWTDSFIVVGGPGSNRLHLEAPPKETTAGFEDRPPWPYCDRGNEPDHPYYRKDVAAYPPGYNEICRTCRRKLARQLD